MNNNNINKTEFTNIIITVISEFIITACKCQLVCSIVSFGFLNTNLEKSGRKEERTEKIHSEAPERFAK